MHNRNCRNSRRYWIVMISALATVLGGCTYFGSGSAHRISDSERIVPHRLKTVQLLEQNYAAAHSSAGFTCALSNLSTSQAVADWTSERDLNILRGFLDEGIRGGYLFSIVDCKPGPEGKVTEYKVVATPIEPGVTGRNAFCIDQTGEMWRASDGNVVTCIRRAAGSERIP